MSSHESEVFDGDVDDEFAESPEAEADVEVPEDGADVPDEGGDDQLYASRDKSPEEERAEKLANVAAKFPTEAGIREAYLELQTKLGEQGRELGAYRQWFEQQQAEQAEPGDGVFDWAEEEPAYTPDAGAVFVDAVRDYASLRPDYALLKPTMDKVVAENPELTLALNAGPAEQRIKTLDLVYRRALEHHQQEVAEAARRNALANAAEGERAAHEAFVASTATRRTEPPAKSAADVIGDEWDAIEATHSDGWRIGRSG